MIERHTKFNLWFKISSLEDLYHFYEKYNPIRDIELADLFKKYIYSKNKEEVEKTITHNFVKTAEANATGLAILAGKSILDIIPLLDESRKNQIERLISKGSIYINEKGGWNDIKGFLSDQEGEFLPFNLETSHFMPQYRIGANSYIVLENDKDIDPEFKTSFEKFLYKNSKDIKLSDATIINMFKIGLETGLVLNAVKKHIAKHNKINIAFATTKNTLDNKERDLLISMLPYIEKAFIMASDDFIDELSKTGINIIKIKNQARKISE